MAEDKFKFAAKLQKLQRMKSTLPNELAQIGQSYFQSEFNKSEWDNSKWEPRKDYKNKRHLLVKTGRLRQSIQNSIKQVGFDRIKWGSDVPYAAVHNYGLRAGKGRGFTMPKRQFMGTSKLLKDKFRKSIEKEFKNALI